MLHVLKQLHGPLLHFLDLTVAQEISFPGGTHVTWTVELRGRVWKIVGTFTENPMIQPPG